ncbi:MAG: hypothetical protein HUK15_07680 [Bacteroidales bacterium]|nr:hypothetical protein [Bacteroidales bacterium]
MSDKHLDVYSFPLVHTKPTWGFLFREKEKERNIVREFIDEYRLGISQIVQLKRGEDVILDNGQLVKSDDVTKMPPSPKSYAYCSDTLPLKRLKDFVAGVDLLYHEATFKSESESFAKMTCHSTAKQAAELALACGAKRLLIGHFSTRYPSSEIVAEAKAVFPETLEASDGLCCEI